MKVHARHVGALLAAAALFHPSPEPLSAQQLAAPDSAGAIEAASDWVGLLDQRDFTAAYEDAAPFLRQLAGSADSWQNFAQMARANLPETFDRRLLAFEMDPAIPGAPPGDYVSLVFAADTEPVVTETIVLMATDDGWKVAMYGVRGGGRTR